MKKNKKKLSLRRETLRVETFMNQVVGGWQTAQVNCDDRTDIGRDSECNLCGTIHSVCAGPQWCTDPAYCDSGNLSCAC